MKQIWIFLLLLMALPCWAAKDPNLENLGTFGDWTAYTYHDEMGRICYMASQPTKSTGKYSKRDDVFLMITHRPGEKAFNVVNTVAGYTYKKGSKPTLTIDKKKAISLVSHEDTAWAKDAQTDRQLVEQMKAGSTGVLRGTSRRGTATTDTFSLKGFSKAYQQINEACDYQ
ncbi:MAG: invasion associated locus B family protein [Alphaproteobacteria bacterium]